jgi:hypothetical protein
MAPSPIKRPTVVFAVFGAAFVFEGISLTIAVRHVLGILGGQPFWRAFRQSKDPTDYIVVFEDGAALLGILVAVAGTS